jgi:putative YphP/YqiW family bacilliredoxin
MAATTKPDRDKMIKREHREENKMPMYPEIMVIPMREELTRLGIEELRTPAAVDAALKNQPGTALVVVNSICGCAAGRMRPAVRLALQAGSRPDRSYSVFAGQEREATDRARSYFTGQMPSSPSIAILRDGKLVYMMQRSQIETREAQAIAADLKVALDQHCAKPAAV